MTCPRCQTINPHGSVACAACGAPLVAMPMAPSYAPPQPGYGQPYLMMQPQAAQRSGIPKTIGILMIVFASLWGLIQLASFAGDQGDKYPGINQTEQWKQYVLMTRVFAATGLLISAFHLYAGIKASGYRRGAPGMAQGYAIVSMIHSVVNLALVYAWARPMLAQISPEVASILGPVFAITAVFMVTWPIIVLILMGRPAAKSACVN